MEQEKMEMRGSDYEKLRGRMVTGFTLLSLYSILLTAALITAAYHMVQFSNQLHALQHTVSHLQQQLEDMSAKNILEEREPEEGSLEKRNVLSEQSITLDQIKSLLRGRTGPVGPPGKDGKDASSIPAIKQLINETAQQFVDQEWLKFSAKIPTYGGAAYIRWGMKSCTNHSKLIYTGLAAGPDYRYGGGGTNLQCLPSDPEYHPNTPVKSVSANLLGKVIYELYGTRKTDQFRRQVPCSVCEASQRFSKLMIPGKINCPSDWTLEYTGILTSAFNSIGTTKYTGRYRTQYQCVDETHEALNDKPPALGGGLLYGTFANCNGDGSLNYCPPYIPNKALSCVVCTR